MPDIYTLIQSAGPGQVNDVLSDITSLVEDASKVPVKARPELAKYNKDQFTTTKVDGRLVIITEYNELEEGQFYDAVSGKRFNFDHLKLAISDIESHENPHQQVVDDLHKSLDKYRSEHYPSDSALSITPPKDDKDKDGEYKICIVGNKYNTQNFWTGRWRSTYTYTRATSKLAGQIRVDVHYYEDGNVRLLTSKDLDLEVGGAKTPEAVAKTIEVAEKKYQEDLNKAFGVLGEGSFKDLRRALPVTRSKINWNSVAAMRIGQEVQGGREKK